MYREKNCGSNCKSQSHFLNQAFKKNNKELLVMLCGIVAKKTKVALIYN